MRPIPDKRLGTIRKAAQLVPGGIALARWLRHRIDPELRAIAVAERTFPDDLFQPYPTTSAERYPALFDALAERLSALPAPRVLSFGCASGEEVRALRSRLPHARITGVDANARAITLARAADPTGDYRCAARIEPGEQWDAILALAVFRHGRLYAERPADCAAVLPFARFAAGVAMLDTCLAPGGYLAIGNANFRFGDTALAGRYAVEPPRLAPVEGDPRYGPDNRLCGMVVDDEVLFRKA